MADVVRTLVGQEEGERGGHQVAHLLKGAWTRRAQERLQLGKRHLDRIEVGTVRRQESQQGAGLFDREPDLGMFVRSEIVDHDDIPGPQGRHEDLLDIGAEGEAVDRPIEDRRRGQGCRTQGGHDRVGLPMAARRVIANAGPAQAAGVATKQIRGHARFVDEDVLARIAERQRGAPLPSRRGDIRPTLFVGVYGFF